jgi:hypothetical protein
MNEDARSCVARSERDRARPTHVDLPKLVQRTVLFDEGSRVDDRVGALYGGANAIRIEDVRDLRVDACSPCLLDCPRRTVDTADGNATLQRAFRDPLADETADSGYENGPSDH